ncbi:uncharacterized protein L969DRAFT_45658 [Mixia osmundae IAM 14324]|uniref:RNA 3'-terminal phosphate cyclase domain-containing protein n=1 Tax=Mixia osmundae (strain CBS 9802 / IAM 14324 / JCM 22182 / KY 12970) TaxID=764103 RepID=G7DXB0_MIXOS|nr:uncharacterized protein L969DRAFT_45658 [Mixia osmundae IAM 14324]KEI41286.1 hypothetical protein L969DRAFT_45658 [Mixia osmundae IAM 14324]GAA95220.1 hypothetical protein E5Q_01876 [Mixia osmundae IAM 14324]
MPSLPAPTASTSLAQDVLQLHGHQNFRHRLVLSLLSQRAIRIENIRSDASYDEPGLRDYEVSFLRLIERISNGTRVEISYTGTAVSMRPGSLQGGQINHTCPLSRSIGWFLEPLIVLGPFCKEPLNLHMHGMTTDGRDSSVDVLRVSTLPHLSMFLESADGLEVRIIKRGHPPKGGGEIQFRCPIVRKLKPGFNFVDPGRISKIRGIAHSVRVSPQFSNRLVSAARGVLNSYIPDIYIYTDVYRGAESGKSPGYALTLLATSTTAALFSAEATSCTISKTQASPGAILSASRQTNLSSLPTGTSDEKQGDEDELRRSQVTPEDIGQRAAHALLDEISRQGCIDRGHEWLVCLLMSLSGEDVSRVKIAGPMDPLLVQFLRDLRDFFGVTFKIRSVDAMSQSDDPVHPAEELYLSCVGIGYTNVAKKAG